MKRCFSKTAAEKNEKRKKIPTPLVPDQYLTFGNFSIITIITTFKINETKPNIAGAADLLLLPGVVPLLHTGFWPRILHHAPQGI